MCFLTDALARIDAEFPPVVPVYDPAKTAQAHAEMLAEIEEEQLSQHLACRIYETGNLQITKGI